MTTYALLHTIFFFFVYAFLGWCVEVAYAAITTRELVNRGFLNGPICPIYGCGMTVMIAVLGRFTMPSSDMAWYQNVLVAFFGGMVITTLVELVGGYILYKMFHTRWWDYSMYRFNLGGFICPQFSLLWGLGSVLLMVVVHPLLSKPSAAIPTLVLIWLDVIFGGLFLADLIVSAIQAVGFSKQLARIDELRKAMRTTSDALTEVIGTSAMTMDTLLDEQKLQLTLAAMVRPPTPCCPCWGRCSASPTDPFRFAFPRHCACCRSCFRRRPGAWAWAASSPTCSAPMECWISWWGPWPPLLPR